MEAAGPKGPPQQIPEDKHHALLAVLKSAGEELGLDLEALLHPILPSKASPHQKETQGFKDLRLARSAASRAKSQLQKADRELQRKQEEFQRAREAQQKAKLDFELAEKELEQALKAYSTSAAAAATAATSSVQYADPYAAASAAAEEAARAAESVASGATTPVDFPDGGSAAGDPDMPDASNPDFRELQRQVELQEEQLQLTRSRLESWKSSSKHRYSPYSGGKEHENMGPEAVLQAASAAAVAAKARASAHSG